MPNIWNENLVNLCSKVLPAFSPQPQRNPPPLLIHLQHLDFDDLADGELTAPKLRSMDQPVLFHPYVDERAFVDIRKNGREARSCEGLRMEKNGSSLNLLKILLQSMRHSRPGWGPARVAEEKESKGLGNMGEGSPNPLRLGGWGKVGGSLGGDGALKLRPQACSLALLRISDLIRRPPKHDE